MKDLILNFSFDRLLSLPPSELLAFVVLSLVGLFLALVLLGLATALLWSPAYFRTGHQERQQSPECPPDRNTAPLQ